MKLNTKRESFSPLEANHPRTGPIPEGQPVCHLGMQTENHRSYSSLQKKKKKRKEKKLADKLRGVPLHFKETYALTL